MWRLSVRRALGAQGRSLGFAETTKGIATVLLQPRRLASSSSIDSPRSASKTERSLFRSLLRLAVKYDSQPAAKLLFYRKTLAQGADADLDLNATTYYTREVIPLLFEEHTFRARAKLLHPKLALAAHLASIVRREFRESREQYNLASRIDAAFTAVRKLSSLWKCFISMQSSAESAEEIGTLHLTDRRGGPPGWVRSTSSSSAAATTKSSTTSDSSYTNSSPLLKKLAGQKLTVSETNSLLPGIILVSHPMIQGPLKRAVILLLEHNTTGSYGVVINRPTSHTLSSSVKNLPSHILDRFGSNRVGFGGMVRRLQYLHKFPSVAGTVIPLCVGPFFSGGKIADATALVSADSGLKNDFHFFVGCCTWDAHELVHELETGYWLPIHSQADQIISMVSKYRNQARAFPTTTAGGNSIIERTEKDSPGGAGDGQSRKSRQAVADSVANNLDTTIGKMLSGDSVIDDDVDLWGFLLSRMGNLYQPCLCLAPWVDASNVESLDP